MDWWKVMIAAISGLVLYWLSRKRGTDKKIEEAKNEAKKANKAGDASKLTRMLNRLNRLRK